MSIIPINTTPSSSTTPLTWSECCDTPIICQLYTHLWKAQDWRTQKKDTKPESQLTPADNSPSTYNIERANNQESVDIVRFHERPNVRKETITGDDTHQKHVLNLKGKPGAKIYHKFRDFYQSPALENIHEVARKAPSPNPFDMIKIHIVSKRPLASFLQSQSHSHSHARPNQLSTAK